MATACLLLLSCAQTPSRPGKGKTSWRFAFQLGSYAPGFGSSGTVKELWFSGDGRYLAWSGGKTPPLGGNVEPGHGRINVWDTVKHRLVKGVNVPQPKSSPVSLVWEGDRAKLIQRSPTTGKIVRWHWIEGQRYHGSPLRAASPDGEFALVVEKGRWRTLEMATGKRLATLPVPTAKDSREDPSAQLTAGGNYALFCADGALHVFDARRGRKLWSKPSSCHAASFVCGAQGVAATGDLLGGACLVYRLTNGEVLNRLPFNDFGAVACSPGPKLAAFSDRHGGGIKLWDLKTNRDVTGPAERGPVAQVAWSASGIVTLHGGESAKTKVILWDPGGKKPKLVREIKAGPREVRLSRNGKYVAWVEGYAAHVRVSDLSSGKNVVRLNVPPRSMLFDVSPDGRRVLIWGAVWDVEHDKRVAQLRDPEGQMGVAFAGRIHREKDTVVLAGRGPAPTHGFHHNRDAYTGVVQLWSSSGGNPRAQIIRLGSPASTLDISPDGRRLLVGALGGVLLIDTELGKPLKWLVGGDIDSSPHFSRDIRVAIAHGVAAFTTHSHVHIYSLPRGKWVTKLDYLANEDTATAISFSDDGRTLAVGSQRGVVRVYKRQ